MTRFQKEGIVVIFIACFCFATVTHVWHHPVIIIPAYGYEVSAQQPTYITSKSQINVTQFGANETRVEIDEEGRQIINVTVRDYAFPAIEPEKESGLTVFADNCGDGSNEFTTNGDVRWMDFPVTYAIDPANSGVSATAARNAMIASFDEFDLYIPGQTFNLISEYNSADIQVRWQFIDGEFGQVGFASWTYIPSTGEITSATITLDSGDNWFVSSVQSCTGTGSSMDIQNIGTHELGHALGLGHVGDDLLTMYPNAFAGETLKRTLGNGDKAGLNYLYPSWSAWTSLGGSLRDSTDPVVIANGDGRLEVFAIGSNNALIHRWQTSPGSSTWSAWTSLGGIVRENISPAVEMNSDGRLEVFVVGANNQLYHKSQTSPGSSTWSAWQSLGGVVRDNTDPVVIANSDNRLQVFVVGTGGSLFTKVQTSAGSSSWSAWTSLGGIIKESISPAVEMNSDGRLEVFVVGNNNGIFHKWQIIL